MLDKLNPFKKSQPNNPLEGLTEDDLRTARKKLELERERTLRQIRDLETRKTQLLQEGAQSDQRVRRDKAYQVKEADEQILQLDSRRDIIAKQILFINRVSFLKQNSDTVGQLVIDQLLGKLDTSALRTYIEDISVRGAAGGDRLQDIVEMFDQNWGNVSALGEDPEIARILVEMERISMPAIPDIPGNSEDLNDASEGRQNTTSS